MKKQKKSASSKNMKSRVVNKKGGQKQDIVREKKIKKLKDAYKKESLKFDPRKLADILLRDSGNWFIKE